MSETQPSAGQADAEAMPDARRERRRAPRFAVDLDCTVFTGRHVHEGQLRDISTGGAMLRRVPGLVGGDMLRIRVARLPDISFHARVRGVSLLGAHVEIEGPVDQELWEDAMADLLA